MITLQVLEKMYREGLTPKVSTDHTLTIRFDECGKLPPPIMMFRKSPSQSSSCLCFLKLVF